MDIEVRCKVDRCFGIDRDQGRTWLEAARQGDLSTLRSIANQKITLGGDAAWKLAHYDGQGTSFGFVGNTALHWTCANGDMEGTRFLLNVGASINIQNNGGSTPLHAAVGHGCAGVVAYLLQLGANPHIVDCCGETPRQLLAALPSRGIAVDTVQRISRVFLLHQLLDEKASQPPAQWDASALRAISDALSLSGVVDKGELVQEVEKAVLEYASRKETCQSNDQNASQFLEQARLRYAQRMKKATEDDDDDDNATARLLAEKASAVKERGNCCYAAGDFLGAVKNYTVAMSMAPGDAVHYSNRSAAYLSLRRYYEALKDASMAMELRPEWPKPFLRACKALLGLGRYADAEAAALRGLTLAPNDVDMTAVLAEAAAGKKYVDQQGVDQSADRAPIAHGRKPWFDCVLCDNKTRDHAETPCCHQLICGTCLTRKVAQGCPLCGRVHGE